MTRGTCVCGKEGYTRCTVHGDPVKGVGVTDGEFVELVARNKGAILEVFAAGEVVLMEKANRLHGEETLTAVIPTALVCDCGYPEGKHTSNCYSVRSLSAALNNALISAGCDTGKEPVTKKIGRLHGKAVGR